MKEKTKQVHPWNVADTITAGRMAASVLLLFLPLENAASYAVYTIAGLTDVLDGWLARKNSLSSDFGARLDSIADLLFYSIVLLRLFPVFRKTLPLAVWCAGGMVLLLRLAAYGVAALKYRCFASLHTWLNKLTGVSVFLLPYLFAVSEGVVYSWVVCILAFAASLEELMIHLCRKDYCADRRSIFQKRSHITQSVKNQKTLRR